MVKIVDGRNCLDAWKAASLFLVNNEKEYFNLIVEIHSSDLGDEVGWMNVYNPKAKSSGFDDIRNVANTIFPSKILQKVNGSRTDFYTRYKRLHSRSSQRRSRRRVWGAYFERMIDFGQSHKNQLEGVIDALSRWTGIHKAAIVFHLSSPETDGLQIMGSPCWQYGELLCHHDGKIDLVAVYRNHDYLNKALGNFIGLARLLNFIASQSGKISGKIICHSVHAYFECGKDRFLSLVNQ